jgi:hypothetical protein
MAKNQARKVSKSGKVTVIKPLDTAKLHKCLSSLAGSIVDVGKVESAIANIKERIGELRTAQVRIGASRRTDAIASYLYDAFLACGVTAGTAANYLSAAKAAINNGTPFTLNPSRGKVKANAKKPGKAKSGKKPDTYGTVGALMEAMAQALIGVRSRADAAVITAMQKQFPDFASAVQEILDTQDSAGPIDE